MWPFRGLALNKNTGIVYASQRGDIRAYTPDGNFLASVGVAMGEVYKLATNATLNRIYGTDQTKVVALDGQSMTVLGYVSVGSSPFAMVADSENGRLYVGNRGDNTVSVVDELTLTEIDTDGDTLNGTTRIPVGSQPYSLALDAATGLLYVANVDSSSITVVDTATWEVATVIPVAIQPYSVATNSMTGRLFAVGSPSTLTSIDLGGINDNHETSASQDAFAIFGSGSSKAIHVEPGDYEDVRVAMRLPPESTVGCSDASWNIDITWDVGIHS